ncbi:MAG TPA: cell wall-binding repeat-containing protein [Thermoleophilaceae bacterium]
MPRRTILLAVAAALALSGCSLKSESDDSGKIEAGVKSSSEKASAQLGFPTVATRDTTRVSGVDPVADAAGVAAALFPATTPLARPGAVTIVDKDDWQGGIAAAVFAGAPLHAPLLLSDGDSLPGATSGTLGQLKPRGETLAKGSQAILVGDGVPNPPSLKGGRIHGRDPYTIAAEVDGFQSVAAKKPSADVVVASGEQPAYAMPAAALAARSGDPVLFVKRASIPAPTRKALVAHEKPNIYLLGPATVISTAVERQLGKLGVVKRIDRDLLRRPVRDPVANAVAFAQYKSRDFGWGARQPGFNYTVANVARPGDAMAAAALGSNGVYAPLLLTDRAAAMPHALEDYLTGVQPGFENDDPSQGVFHHVWILGNKDAVSTAVQARIDQLTQLVPVDNPAAK